MSVTQTCHSKIRLRISFKKVFGVLGFYNLNWSCVKNLRSKIDWFETVNKNFACSCVYWNMLKRTFPLKLTKHFSLLHIFSFWIGRRHDLNFNALIRNCTRVHDLWCQRLKFATGIKISVSTEHKDCNICFALQQKGLSKIT